MTVIPWLLLLFVCFIMIQSLYEFIKGGHIRFRLRDSRFSIEIFVTLIIIYSIVIIGFGLIYFTLSIQGIILVEHGELRQVSLVGSMIHSLYFSGVTMLTMGYGDITPVGIGRLIAVVEAMIGYILPTAFVMRLFQEKIKDRDQ